MNEITTQLDQAELALAAYANMPPSDRTGPAYVAALEAADMTPSQAADFAAQYTVVAQYIQGTTVQVPDEVPSGLGRPRRAGAAQMETRAAVAVPAATAP